MPFVSPAPLSAWMLPGLIVAYPHPSAISCSVAGGSDGAAAPPGAEPWRRRPKPRAGGGGAPGAGGIPDRPPNIIIIGTGLPRSAGVTTVIWISTVMSGYARVVHGANQLLADHRRATDLELLRAIHTPCHLRNIRRHAADHFAIEILDNLRPALLPPHVRARDLLAVLERQRIGKVRVGIGECLVVVGVVRCRLVPARTRTQRRDPELLHHVLVIRRSRRRIGVRRRSGGRRRLRRCGRWRCLHRRLLSSHAGCQSPHQYPCRQDH